MTVVTGGLVSIEDGKKPAEDYAPARKVRVELRFETPEGGDAQADLDNAANVANAKVKELLGNARTTDTATVATAQPGTAPAATKEDLAKAAGVSDGDQKKAKRVPKEAKAADDMSEFDVPATTSNGATEINDADLLATIQKKNGALKKPEAIRDLIGKFNPKPGEAFQARQIAAGQRGDFVKQLEALA